MPFNCFSCFGGGQTPVEAPLAYLVVDKVVEAPPVEDQRRDEQLLHYLQSTLAGFPTDSAEARLAHIATQVLLHLHAKIVRLYVWSTEDADETTAGSLVLLTVDWYRPDPASPGPFKPSQLPDLPGQRIAIPALLGQASTAASTPLLQQAIHNKTAAVFTYSTSSAGPIPPDCAADHAVLGTTSFAALPLITSDRLLGVLWLGTAPTASLAAPTAGPGHCSTLPSVSILRQLSNSVTMCLLGGVDPDYLAWLVSCLRRLAATTTLQALVGELCDTTSQHLRRRFLVDAVAHAAVVPDAERGTTAFMLDHRPQPGGPGGIARWTAAAARQQANMSLGAVGPGAAAAMVTGMAGAASLRRSDSFTSPMGMGSSRPPLRTSSHASMRPNGKRPMSLAEQAAARAANTGGGGAAGCGGAPGCSPLEACRPGGGTQGPSPGRPPMHPGAAAMVVPALRAKGFQLSHTLLQRMVTAVEGRGPDGVYAGVAVADCGRHVQDVHQPSRDVCMLMAGGVRGADMTTDASDSALFASERSTGRIAMQSLVLVGLHMGTPGQQQEEALEVDGGGGVRGGSAVLALYLAFPTRLPPLLVSGAHASCRQLLSVMLAQLVRRKVATELEAEFATLCAGVPGSYAVVVPSATTASHTPAGRDAHTHGSTFSPPSHLNPHMLQSHGSALAGTATATGLLDASGLQRRPSTVAPSAAGAAAGTVALEPSIGAPSRTNSSRMIPLASWISPGPPGPGAAPGRAGGGGGQIPAPSMSLGASAKLLAAYTDAGCRANGSLVHGSVGDRHRAGGVPDASIGRVAAAPVQEGSARTAGGPGAPSGSAVNGVVPQCQDRLFSSLPEVDEEDVSPHEEADVMLSSDPRIDELDPDGEDGGDGGEDEDLFPVGTAGSRPSLPAPRVPQPPAAVLTVTEADATSSMRQHMGLLVESLMSTLRSTAHADDHYDSSMVSARRSMDIELDDLRLSGVLGDGGSGVVLCGMLGTVPVAVKIIQMPEVDQLLLASAVRALGQDPDTAAAAAIAANNQQRSNNQQPQRQKPHESARNPAPPPAHGSLQQQQAQGSPPGQKAAVVAPGGGGAANPASSACSSKLKQARRDMLRNAMELAVMKSISHVNITTVYAVYDNVILERVKREGGSTAYALRRCTPADMQIDKNGSKPVFVALCMELCDAGSLASKLEERSFPRLMPTGPLAHVGPGPLADDLVARSGGRPRVSRVLDMVGIYLTVLEVSCALRYLHARRLLHRDIKSANILLKASPADPRGWTCKLADFGSALVLDQFQPPEELDGDGETDAPGPEGGSSAGRWFAIQEQSWGTITHMSPESMDNNSRVDASSDIFALGIVMWEISSGRGYRPYKELAPEQIGAAVRQGLRPTFTPEVPAPYRLLAQQCWAAEPHKRPSAVQVVSAVKAQIAHLQSEARMQRPPQALVTRAPAGPHGA